MVFEAIAELVAERVEKDVSEITPESSFKELGIDSLDTVELLMNLEDKLDMEIELDDEDGTLVYEVEFKFGGMEYSYEINAATGAILKHEAEIDD